MDHASRSPLCLLVTMFLWDFVEGSSVRNTLIDDCSTSLQTTCHDGGYAIPMSADLHLGVGHSTASFCRCRRNFFGPGCGLSDESLMLLAGSLTLFQASSNLKLRYQLHPWAGGVIIVDFALISYAEPSWNLNHPGGYHQTTNIGDTKSEVQTYLNNYDVQSIAKLRYWCQGKPSCTLDEEALFSGSNGYLEIRQNVSPLEKASCQPGCAYFPNTWTCYCMTDSLGFIDEVRNECRQRGGELARFFIGDQDNSSFIKNRFVSFLVHELSFFSHFGGETVTKSFYVHRENMTGRNYAAARNGANPIYFWDNIKLSASVAEVDLPWTDAVSMKSPTVSSGRRLQLRALCEVPPYVPFCSKVESVDALEPATNPSFTSSAPLTSITSIDQSSTLNLRLLLATGSSSSTEPSNTIDPDTLQTTTEYSTTQTSWFTDTTSTTTNKDFTTDLLETTAATLENFTTDPFLSTTVTNGKEITREATTPKPKFCPRVELPEIEVGYFFPRSQPNQWVLKRCPRDWVGNATWYCQASGEWRGKLPSLSSCKSSLDSITESMNQLNETEDVAGLLDTLTDALGQAAEEADDTLFLAPSDLVDIAKLLETAGSQQYQIIDQVTDQGQKKRLALGYFKSMNALSEQALATTLVWETMEVGERLSTANRVQSQIELGALKVIEFLASGEEEKVLLETHAVTVRKVPKTDLEGRNAARWTSFGYNSSKITLGRNGLLNQMNSSEESLGVSFFGFKNLHEILIVTGNAAEMMNDDSSPTSHISRITGINTQIVGAKLSAGPGSDSRNASEFRVILEFKNWQTVDSADPNKTWACVFWDLTHWSDEGCSRISSLYDTWVGCECNHLTSFAVLMEVDSKLPPIVEKILTIATLAGCSVSVVCLVLSAAIFAWVKTTTTRQIDICLCLSLAGAQILVIFGMDATTNALGCAFIAGTLHYMFLTSFAWMFIKGLDVYLKITATLQFETRATVYHFVGGFGLPAIVVCITAGVSRGDAYGYAESCWLYDLFTITFVAPIAIVILVNFVVVGVILRVAIRRKTAGALKNSRSGSQPLKFALGVSSLASILGLTWILGITYIAYPHTSTAILFTVFNSTQGTFIFVFFIVANEKTRTAVLKKSGVHRCFPSLVSTKTSASSGPKGAASQGEPSNGDESPRMFRRWNLIDEVRATLKLMPWRRSIRISHSEPAITTFAVSQSNPMTTANVSAPTAAGVPGGTPANRTASSVDDRLI